MPGPAPSRGPSPAAVALLYAGVLFGVSFIATPAKFLAESITLAQALDVGRETFGVFGWVEVGFSLALGATLLGAPAARHAWLPASVVLLAVVQMVGLRPPLDDRLVVIMAGGTPPESGLHTVYGVMELAKLAALVGFAHANRRA